MPCLLIRLLVGCLLSSYLINDKIGRKMRWIERRERSRASLLCYLFDRNKKIEKLVVGILEKWCMLLISDGRNKPLLVRLQLLDGRKRKQQFNTSRLVERRRGRTARVDAVGSFIPLPSSIFLALLASTSTILRADRDVFSSYSYSYSSPNMVMSFIPSGRSLARIVPHPFHFWYFRTVAF